MDTVEKIYKYAEDHADSTNRPHLGASIIGDQCSRKLWYTFRWASERKFDGRLLRLFQTGHLEEDRLIDALKKVGVNVSQFVPGTKTQFSWSVIGGHFGGSCDGKGQGLEEVLKKVAILEFKTMAGKYFQSLKKDGVEKSQYKHYCQMTLYMGWANLSYAYYLVKNKDTDELYQEVVEYDQELFDKLIHKATKNITSQNPLERVSGKKTFYLCNMCDFRGVCWNNESVAVNCRTCLHSTPEIDSENRGLWRCEKYNAHVSTEKQRVSSKCPSHLYIPSLLPYEVDDTNGNSVVYLLPDGTEAINGDGGYKSSEMWHLNPEVIKDETLNELRDVFGGTIVSSETLNKTNPERRVFNDK